MTNLRDLAKFKADAASVVFEGTPTRITLAWDVLSAKPGKLISADFWSVERGFDRVHGPHLVVTFRVQRAYKGNPDGEIRINTGVATVDCSGRMFEPNIPYLVYAYGPPDNLWVSTCSPGGWMGSSSLEPELRYLRGERPTREDTASYRPQEDARADRRRFEASTGTICGKVRRGALRPDVFERVAFLPMAGYSPWSPDEAWPTGGGEFCH